MSIANLRGILKYVPQFKDQVLVVAVDGEVVESENFTNVLLDLAVMRSLGIRLVLIHGASHQIQRLARERGIVATSLAGDGVTDAQTLELAIDAASRLNYEILRGLTSVDLNAAYANAIIAGPMGIIGGVDHLHTGKIIRTDRQMLTTLLNEGIIPVLPPLGFDGEGATFRINSDQVAVRVAEDLGAIKIVFLSTEPGVVYDGVPQQQISDVQVRQMLKKRALLTPPSLRSKVAFAEEACTGGVPRVHILDGRVNEALLAELFSNEGVGTMIYSDEYARIRPAVRRDLRKLLALLNEAAAPAAEVEEHRHLIDHYPERYTIYEVDGNATALLCVRTFPKEALAEIDSLYIGRAHLERGYGRALISHAEETARKAGVTRMAVANAELYGYFREFEGYQPGTEQDLAPSRQDPAPGEPDRRRVLVKRLEPVAE
jgi:amino-acid N-acetyltransferase